MKKRTIWTIAVIMGLSFLALLLLQLNYIEEMAEMKREQFDESVNRALYQASRNMELNETLRYLERDVDEKESQGASKQGGRSGRSKAGYSSFQMKTVTNKPSQTPKAMILRNDSSSISATKKSLQEIVRNRYVYQKSMLDEVVYNILYSASEKPLKERVNFKLLDQDLKAEMMNNGINIPYHFVVQTQDGREVYRCPDYTDEGVESSFSQVLFRNDPPNRRGIVRIHFPEMNSYIFSSVRFIDPVGHLHVCPAGDVYLHHRRDLPTETLLGDQERLHQQHDPRTEDPDSEYLAGLADDERQEPDEVAADDRASRRGDQ